MRELRNVLERAAILCDGGLITADHLCLHSSGRSGSATTDLSVVERTTIAKVLQECAGNKTKAARRLGLSRTQLHLRVRKYGSNALSPPEYEAVPWICGGSTCANRSK